MTRILKSSMRWLPGTILGVAIIAAILYFVDLELMAEAVRNANYGLLTIALALGFLWMAVRAIVWRTLLRDRASYTDVFFTVGEGYFLNNFLPFRLGEIGRAFLLSRKSTASAGSPSGDFAGQRLHFAEIIPTIVIERVVDLGFSAIMLLASLPFVVGAEGSERIGIIVGSLVALGLAGLYVVARNRQWALDLFHKLAQRLTFLRKLDGLVEPFFAGLAVLTDGWVFARFLFWMVINWIIAIVSYYLMIRAFFPEAQVVWGMFGLGAAAFGGAIPGAPGAVGTFEGAFAGALTLLTGDQSTSLTVALVGRLYNYLNSGVVGGLGLAREGQTLTGIYQQLLRFRENRTTPEPE